MLGVVDTDDETVVDTVVVRVDVTLLVGLVDGVVDTVEVSLDVALLVTLVLGVVDADDDPVVDMVVV